MFHALEKGWTTTDYLLAHVIDGVRVNNWQRTESARKNPPRNVPEPFPRPADMERKKQQSKLGDTANVGGSAATVITVEEYIARRVERERRWRDKHEKGGG